MPRVAISVIQATRAGVALTSTTGDPVNNHYVTNDGHTGVIVENTGSTVVRTAAQCLLAGPIPDNEAVVRLPARMVQLIREACDAAEGAAVR